MLAACVKMSLNDSGVTVSPAGASLQYEKQTVVLMYLFYLPYKSLNALITAFLFT